MISHMPVEKELLNYFHVQFKLYFISFIPEFITVMLGSTIFLFFGQLSSVNFLFQPQHVFHTLFLVLSQYFQ